MFAVKDSSSQLNKRAWALIALDFCCLIVIDIFILIIYPSSIVKLSYYGIALQMALSTAAVFGFRFAGGIYKQIWRYASTGIYLHLMILDFLAGCAYCVLGRIIPFELQITFVRAVSVIALNLLCSLGIRFIYQYLREQVSHGLFLNKQADQLVRRMLGVIHLPDANPASKIKIAIVGAGRVGSLLAEELINNPNSAYEPYCFIDIDHNKIGRKILGIHVLNEKEISAETLQNMPIQEIVFALPQMDADEKKKLYDYYSQCGCRIKVYDYPLAQVVENGKRQLREFSIEELLFRKSIECFDEKTSAYYHNKTVLISGGGGSIGSELCRQIARMHPKQLIILDVYENNAYDIQQELRIAHGPLLNLQVEIASVQDAVQLEKIFSQYRPQIVLHAAAHKHVPLMEHNCVEAVKNNVFGTWNIVNAAEKYGVEKFIMISTDKAVNPTNVMGATKRMCEMIVQSRADSKTNFCITRFGNVLGSNGSVIPLFKRQIMNGGPVTLTDKRIIRYFMTISEASQLVLQSGAMAKRGELYVLDMGKPVKILELAENMIRLSGLEPYKDIDIIETGLRPGEKLYEELLMKAKELDKTENSMIFIEKAKPLTDAEIVDKLNVLRIALDTCDENHMMKALKEVVPTYHAPESVNAKAAQAREMQLVEEQVLAG